MAVYTLWVVWWSDKSARFHVQEIRTFSDEYNAMTKKRLAYDCLEEAVAERDRLNGWLDESRDHPIAEPVPAGPHIVRMT